MKHPFAVTGIGLCVGTISDHEDLIEALTTGKQPTKMKAEPTARHAINAALKYCDEKPVMLISGKTVPQDILEQFKITQQKVVGRFAQMLQETVKTFGENQYDNVLLLGQNEEGYAATLLSKQPQRCFAQVSIEPATSATELPLMDAMMRFITAVVEIRFAFKLDGTVKDSTCVWHWMEKRSLTRTIDGIAVSMNEAELVNQAVFRSKRYLLPVVFNTIDEARENLRSLLDDAARLGLYNSMQKRIADLKGENIIVLLAEDFDSLSNQMNELLAKSDQLLSEGFRWKSTTGSLYIRKTTQTPKIVFMNPPGGMFHSKPFHRFVSKLYDFVDGPFQLDRRAFFNASQNETLHRYLDEINITFAVMYLLNVIGVKPDILSGASMGEIAFNLSNLSMDETLDKGMAFLEPTIRNILEGGKALEKAYFGHEIDLKKYYLKWDAEAVKKAIGKYDDVFVIIEGSPKDILICGEKTSCEKLIQELGCIAIEMDDPTYVHTPVVESEFEKIRAGFLSADVHLDVQKLPYQLFSTYGKKNLDNSCEMFAENLAAIITRTVNYTDAVKALYDQDARVFIDLSTTQLCGGWAKTTLSRYPDAEVVSIFEDKDTAEYLTDLCAVLLAWNTSFDFKKLYSRLTFTNDAPVNNETTLQHYIADQLALNQKAYEIYLAAEEKLFAQIMAAHAGKKTTVAAPQKNYLWDRAQAIQMTENSMAAILGEPYKEVDQYPIRARMPLPPYLFVSRIVSIDAEYGKLRPSSIVSEYNLDEDCVFRMGNSQISPLIGAEASHIGIFLLAYMGIDAMFNGTLSYRAIGSSQVTYSERPFRVGDTMRTALKIDRFLQNGSTILVFFTFETYNGDELIAVTETTGGFFTREQLASNKGIISPKQALSKPEPQEFPHFSDLTATTYDQEQVAAFYNGNYEACFGKIQTPLLRETYYLPHDVKMIDRVTSIDYSGGMYRRGIICGEKQITPDMWPFKAHFKNDPVFPAIIMTDGVSQLGMFLFAHAGLLSRFERTTVTAIHGNTINSKFRGQARQGYSTLRYEVHVKKVVQTADSISVYFDAKIFNDGLPIIQVESYALKIASDPN
jgi:3-hydroxymyristoyl/3-hydroxydecanoyl-(acyl carrier protein) dehydratase